MLSDPMSVSGEVSGGVLHDTTSSRVWSGASSSHTPKSPGAPRWSNPPGFMMLAAAETEPPTVGTGDAGS